MEDHTNLVMVIWQCDKRDCGSINRRWLDASQLIFDDFCDSCSKYIHEPITEVIAAKGKEET